jgi:tetratricopeptide (TPR) repeat protein
MQMSTTVQAVLAARIDRLPSTEKRLLHTAAVIGTEVPLPLLHAIAEMPEAAVYDGLRHLQAAEFLYETRLVPEHAYTFKHALTHEVAYGSLPQERRRGLHARIVKVVEALYPDRLAHHALRGEVWEKALAYSRQAGDKTMARSAFREAVAFFEQALTALRHLPEQRHTQGQAIDLRLTLNDALRALGEPGERSVDYLRQAATLAEALGDQRRVGQICTAMSHHYWRMDAHEDAITYGLRALSAASGDAFQQAGANGYLGTFYVYLGAYHRAIDVFRQSIAALEGELRHTRSSTIVSSVRTCGWLAECLAELGEFAEGITYAAEAVRIAESAAHLGSAIFAQSRLGRVALLQGDLQHARPILETRYGPMPRYGHPALLVQNYERLGPSLCVVRASG